MPGSRVREGVRLIAAALDGSRRALPPGPAVRSAADVAALLGPAMRAGQQEAFVAVLLDVKQRVVATTLVSLGTLDCSLVHPRDLFRPALRASAASVILAHNHPSGNPEPSPEDLAPTRRLADAGRLLGIPVADHVIVGDGRYVSLAERGLL